MNGGTFAELAKRYGGKAGFCLGLAWLAVFLPPNYEAWLAGELDGAFMGSFVGAATAVLQGFLTIVMKLIGGENPFKDQKMEVKTDVEQG